MRYLRVGVEESAALLAESSYYTLGMGGGIPFILNSIL